MAFFWEGGAPSQVLANRLVVRHGDGILPNYWDRCVASLSVLSDLVRLNCMRVLTVLYDGVFVTFSMIVEIVLFSSTELQSKTIRHIIKTYCKKEGEGHDATQEHKFN